ncbi:MAG TPA: prolyl oligopeptidase family serine peptidase [Phycisphaerae bacterium]|nr:prolyl oligopeptidase family serine peptidase [Phycisphaerae bacterium]
MEIDEIRDVAWIPDDRLTGPPRGVVLAFHGLGHAGERTGPTTEELAWLSAGGLVVFPYSGPWSWMNRQTRAFVDELVDSVYRCFPLADDAPLICTGGSMGGYSALLYTRYAARAVSACLANAPVCDLAYHFRERPDLPKTIRCAFRGYAEDLDALLAEHSPLSQVAAMPDVPYLVIHGDADPAVSKAHHSDPFVAAMREAGRSVEYVEVAGMGHCGPLPVDVFLRQIEFVTAALG